MRQRLFLGIPAFPLRPLEIAIMVILIAACSQLGYVGHPRYGPFIAIADVLCVLIAPFWIFRVIRSGRLKKLHWPPAALGALFITGVLSLSRVCFDDEGALSLSNIKSGVIEIAQLALYFGFAWMLFVDVLNNASKLARAMVVMLIFVSLSVIWALYQYVSQPDLMKVCAGFGNRNVYCAFLTVVLPLFFGIALYGKFDFMRPWVYILCVLAAITMVGPPHIWILTGILCWLTWLRGGRSRLVIIPITLAAVLLINTGLPKNQTSNISGFFDVIERGELHKLEISETPDNTGNVEEGTAADTAPEGVSVVKKRWIEWQPALNMLADNLPLGVGAGAYQRKIGEAQYYGALPNLNKTEPDTNNLYLVIGASLGLLGLISLLSFMLHFGYMASNLWLRAQGALQRSLVAGLYGAVIGIWATNLFTSLLVRGVAIIWAFIFAAIYVIFCETPKESEVSNK